MKLFIITALLVSGVIGSLVLPRADSRGEMSSVTQASKFVLVNEAITDIDVKAYVVFDADTGEIILSQDPDALLPIASITKLFTAASLLESGLINEVVEVTASEVAAEGRAGKLEAGQKYQMRELLFPLLLESSNDAAETIKNHLPKVEWPNIELADASGLSDVNQATARNLAAEAGELYRNQKYLFDITKLSQHIGTETGWVNNSPVKDLEGYQGGKHGYTVAANRTLVAFFTEKNLDNRDLGYVILGSNNLKADTIKLRAKVADSVQLK